MVGREVDQIFEPRTDQAAGQVILEVQGLNRGSRVKDISFQLRAGEILGIAGLVGAGRTEMLETIFGVHPASSGTISIDGATISIRRPDQAIQQGIGYVTEDRKAQGLFPVMTVAANIVMTRLAELVRALFVNWQAVNQLADEFIQRLDIRTPSAQQRVQNLSGGNQQKVVISRWLTLNPRVLMLDEPTRGIDVGAKSEIYRLMRKLASEGVGIIMVSSELPEILGVSDRVLVMHEGRIAGEFDPRVATQDALMTAATGTYQEGYRP